MVETELKYLLNKEDFKHLYNCLKQNGHRPCMTRQVNYYFASDNPIKETLLNIRIRFAKGKQELTCKIPIIDSTTDSIQNSYEYNVSLEKAQALDYIKKGISGSELKTLLHNMFEQHSLDSEDLICYGHLRTARIALIVSEDLPPLLFDINAYLGVFDYELEWELEQALTAEKIIKETFRKNNISVIGQMKPKRRRYFERMLANSSIE